MNPMPRLTIPDDPQQISELITSGAYGSLEEVLTVARTLRKRADTAEKRFMLFLQGLELSGIWKGSHSGTFDSYLSLFQLCSSSRYKRSIAALAALPASTVDLIGLPASRHVIRIEDPDNRASALQDMVAKASQHNVPLSEQTARTLANKWLSPRPHPEANRVRRIQELEAENVQLRTLIHEKEQRILQLEAQIESLGGEPHETHKKLLGHRSKKPSKSRVSQGAS